VPDRSVLYLVTEPWYFANHRLDHAKALLADGFEVHVATRRGDRWDELVAAGCTVHPIELARGAAGPAALWHEASAVRRLVRSVRPGVVHAVALKPVAVALSLLPMRARPALVLSVNGLGISAATGGRRLRVIRAVIAAVSRLRRVELLFQTESDRRAVLGSRSRGTVIPGVGVDIHRFAPPVVSPGDPPVRVVYLGRAVVSKGLLDLASALEGDPVPGLEVHLHCSLDETSPGALTVADRERLGRCPGMVLHPPTREPSAVLAGAHAAILPSRAGEGVSKFVLEALACGVPVLLSAESGSGEVIEPDVTGLVFRAGDPVSIRSALAAAAAWTPERRARMAAACRSAAERRYSLDVILPEIVALHRRAVGATP
jgi:glycosyltransferase involved in cell wall biosynthesis